MVGYMYDVFISYKRHREWTPWTREHLGGLLDAYLTQELGRPPSIFIDERIEPGADWPNRLATAISGSRILLAVFSRDYFGSQWCLHELDLMHERRLAFPDSNIIVPVIGHDGDLIPDQVARIQSWDLSPFRNTDLQRRTKRYEKFSDSINRLAPVLSTAIASAPQFDPNWLKKCEDRFNEVYSRHCGGGPPLDVQTMTLKPMPFPMTPPRVNL
ncbi:MAG: toll/interleukin-1 receptor domain-containing protein [Planctomycetota bacterium]